MEISKRIIFYCFIVFKLSLAGKLLIDSNEKEPGWPIKIDGYSISDTIYNSDKFLYHLLIIKDSDKISHIDTFSISEKSMVPDVSIRIYTSFIYPLVIERYFFSPLTGSSFEVRTFKELGDPFCNKQTYVNDGSFSDPIGRLNFTEGTDEPVIERIYEGIPFSTLNVSCSEKMDITNIYIEDNKSNMILFDTKEKEKQVLIKDPNKIFTILEISESKLWVIVSKMSANPNEAYGTNEEKLLIYIPTKKQKIISDFYLAPDPDQ